GAVQAVAEGALTTISTTGTFNVFLPNLLNDFITLTISSNDVLVADANNLVVVNSTINGDLNIHAIRDVTLLGTITAGDVKVNAGLDIYGAGNTFGSTLDNNINIDGGRYVDFANFGSPSRFNGAVYFNGTIVVVAATGDLVLSGGNASIQLLLQTDGSIRQDVNAAYLNVSGNAVLIAKNDIVLNTPGNVITGSISSSATNITLLNTETLILGATTATGDLTLIAPAGVDQMASAFISLVNPLGVHGVIAPVDDDRIASVTVSGKTDIQAAGNMVNLPYLTNSLPVLAVVADSAMIGTAGAVNLLPSTVSRYILKAVGAITQTGVLTSDLLDMAAAGKFGFAPITLDSANKLREVSVQGSTVVINNSRYLAMGLSFADSLKLNAQGDLFQVDPMRVNNSLTITAQDVSLQNADNSLFGTLTLNAASAKVFNTANFNLGAVTVTGLLALESSGAINQTGVLNAGQSTFTATGDITLNNAANAFGKLSAKAANIGVTSIGALTLDGVYGCSAGSGRGRPYHHFHYWHLQCIPSQPAQRLYHPDHQQQ
ncbi:MAG: hypothetical protein NT142_04315, partial [Planctomycetota bacterium]|nr:hypothetical protein [Planctomycetota bacterium]